MAQRTAIVIDLIINGLKKVEQLGQLLLVAIANPKIRAGFQVLQQALGGVSAAAQNASEVFKRFVIAMAAVSQNPAFIAFAKKVAVLLKIISNEMKNSTQAAKSKTDALKKFSMALGIVSILLRSLAHLTRELGMSLMRLSRSILDLFKALTSSGGEIQAKLSELQALLGLASQSGPQFKALSDEIVRVGKESSKTISEVAGLANELARAGFGAEDITKSVASVVQLSEAAGLSAEQAATIAANVKTMFSLQASELGRVNDVLTATANASTTSVQSLGESFTYVGPLASSFGFSVEEISAALGVLANAGQKGSVAGAGLQQMFSQLIAHADEVDAALAKHGKSFEDVNPEIHSVVEIMQVFQDVNLSTADIINIFSERARKTFLALQSQGVDTLKAFEKLNKESRGLAATVAEVRMDNLPGDVLKMKSAFEALQFTVFQVMEERLREIIQWVTEIINKTSAWVESNKELILYLTDVAIKTGIAAAAIGALIFTLGTFEHAVSMFVTGAATIVATVSLLGEYINGLFATIGKLPAALAAAERAMIQYAVSCRAAAASTLSVQTAVQALGKTFTKVVTYITSTIGIIFAPITVTVAAIVGAVMAAFYGIYHNWTKIKDALVKSFGDIGTSMFKGFMAGFGDVYEVVLKPALDSFGDVVVYLIEQLGYLFGSESTGIWETAAYVTGVVLAGLVTVFQLIATGVVAVVGFIVQLVNVFLDLITLDFTPIYDFLDWLWGVDKGANAAASSVLYLGRSLSKWSEEMRQAIDTSNNVISDTVDLLGTVGDMSAQLEKGGGLVARIFQLQPNELKELAKVAEEIKNAGGELSSQGVAKEEKKLDEKLAELKAQRQALETQYSESFLAGLAKAGGKETEILGIKQTKAQLDKLISDVEKAKVKLQDIGKNFKLIDTVIGSGGYENFKNKIKDTENKIEDFTNAVKTNKSAVERIEATAVGGSEFGTEAQKKESLRLAKDALDWAVKQRDEFIKEFANLSQVSTKELFDIIYSVKDEPVDQQATLIAKKLADLQKSQEGVAESAEKWKKQLEEIQKMYEKIDEFLRNARAKLASAGLDPQSKEEFEFNFSTETARMELDKMIESMRQARDAANAMGDIGSAMQSDAKLQELEDIKTEISDQADKDRAAIAEKHDKERQDSLLDMELELAKQRKDKAREIALTQQKFDAETAELREKFIIRDKDGKEIGQRAGLADFERMRQEKLVGVLKDVNDSYADKKPVDRSKEMVDIQNESYQILLKKVQSTRDLFMLERALLKIQEMQQAAALKASRRAIQAESLVEKIRQKRDEAAAMGMNTSNLDLDLKRAQERAGIMRGFSDLKNQQSGIGTSDVNALGAAASAMDATSKAVMDKIGAKMAVIGGALTGMSSKFAAAAETWIDSFVTAWENSSDRIESTILGTFEQIKLALETGGLNVPAPEAALSAVTGVPAASAATAGGSVVNNFQVTATDPLEAGKKMARMIDQSTRDL